MIRELESEPESGFLRSAIKWMDQLAPNELTRCSYEADWGLTLMALLNRAAIVFPPSLGTPRL